MTDEDRKPPSDEAGAVFTVPVGGGATGGGDGESSTTSEFALPEGLAPPKPVVGEAETTSEFALPVGLDVPQPPGDAAGSGRPSVPRARIGRPPSRRPPVSLW